ncbi:serine hydrolase domain-containing protein [Paenibacillus larvae]|uniref:serine hydrolase domain-containing protein n=1 Tax=Paenibacillus larvae TaxID=1464 RepID=UPI0028918353|nr:serine hydrolase domain-containing protein [Paenibacillus larvae]MDT2194485.1 serine hydrolase [Paenibacillus larvae]
MMRMIKKVIFLCLLVLFTFSTAPANAQISKSQLPLDKMERWIEEQMDKAGIPGLSVVISGKDSTLYQKGFGYAGLNNKRPVTGRTLFELGSTSKAFTGLAVLQLQDQGIIRLSDPVSAYLPWFKMHFKESIKAKKLTVMLTLHWNNCFTIQAGFRLKRSKIFLRVTGMTVYNVR